MASPNSYALFVEITKRAMAGGMGTPSFIPATTQKVPYDQYEDPLKEIIYATMFLSTLSLFTSLFVLTVFWIQLRRRSTVMRNSLNYLWVSGLLCGIGMSLESLTSYSFWVTQGNDDFLENKTACVVSGSVHDFFRTGLAGFLLSYYMHIYMVRKYDEPRAIKYLPYYCLGTLILSLGVATFSAIELPKSFDAIHRCEGNLVSLTSTIPILIPTVVELGIVVAGLVAAFNLLCSDSNVTTAASKRRVIVHVLFMLCAFAARIVTAAVTITRSSDGDVPDRLSSLTVGAQIAFVIAVFYNWLMGFTMSCVFIYCECLLFVVRSMLSGGASDDANGDGKKDFNFSATYNRSRRRADSMLSDYHSLSRPLVATEGGIVEEHLQAYTLSYTVRSSSLYADGALPPSGHM